MDKEKEIEEMAKELHCATNESFISCRKIARILVERRGYGNVKQAVKEFVEKVKAEVNNLPKTALSFSVRREAPMFIDLVYKELYGADE